MKKKNIIVDPEKPLPAELSKEWEETFAKLILEHYFSDVFSNLSTEDERPDLRNEELSIGVEVTNAESPISRELDSLYTKQYTYGDKKVREKAMQRISELGGSIKEFFLMHPVKYCDLSELYRAFESKTEKLNSKYKIFNYNYLFIFDTICVREHELPVILTNFRASSTTYRHIFSKVFLYCFGGHLYEFNLMEGSFRTFNDLGGIPEELSMKARKIVDKKYQG